MPKLKVLSGMEVIRIFELFGFFVFEQRGSHVKLQRLDSGGRKQSITVPNHYELDKGTLKGIFNQASKLVSADKLREHFYTQE